ncbi:PREDICTED: uncharacterized protein LOC107069841 [Polistes dominula]|uniref:U5 small nuclear ribonucleoprotein TSSC4 n=1 Tax=Polistes dominula TaxID=743375 RepID=A0ABM1IRX6_POLDO|nr:PREDICTED: uncharacterized protein LOC107069841 [Polistes dominula]
MQLIPNNELYSPNVNENCNSAAFSNKMKAMVDQLSILEKEYNRRREDVSSDLMEVDVQPRAIYNSPQIRNNRKRSAETLKFRGKISIFKRPEGPAPRSSINRTIPDYHKNPHKWTKYTLDDVSNEDMTDQSNTHTALSFLKELRERKMQEAKLDNKMDVDETVSNENKSKKITFQSQQAGSSTSIIKFNKPKSELTKSENTTVIENYDGKQLTYRNSKLILPEYVVGQKPMKKAKKSRIPQNICPATKIKLDHLQEIDQE